MRNELAIELLLDPEEPDEDETSDEDEEVLRDDD